MTPPPAPERLRVIHLWDAGPDLVAACRLAVRALEQGDVDALPVLRAAIAKAEGR